MLDEYLKLNWYLIPVYYGTKIPINDKWNIKKEKSNNLSLMENLGCNIGLLLGEIIDVEADTKEKDEMLNSILSKYPHPIYKSSKYNHHLFQNPYKNLTRFSKNGIEFRANRHYSLLPPSKHPNGEIYEWLTDFTVIPPFPLELKKIFSQLGGDHVLYLKGKDIGSDKFLHCNKCKRKVRMPQERYILEQYAFHLLNCQWECNKCRKKDIFEFIRQLRLKLIKQDKRNLIIEENEKKYIKQQIKNTENKKLSKDGKNIYTNDKNQEVENQRNLLLNNLKDGEYEFKKMLDYLYINFDKSFKTRQKKAFFSKEVLNDYFFIDFCLESLRLYFYIDNNNEFMNLNWEKYYKPLLGKYKYNVVIYPGKDILSKPKNIFIDLLQRCIAIENYSGLKIKNLFRRKSLTKIAEEYLRCA